MIAKFEIHTVKGNTDKKIQNYITKKIAKLDRYAPRHARESMHVQVFLKEHTKNNKKSNTCEVVMNLPGEVITVKESTINMYAAVDIVETKLKNLLKKYKEKHTHLKFHHRVLARIKRRSAE